MCSTMISCCTEGQSVKAADLHKTLLQPEDVGVGLWLESGNCNRSEAGGNNVRASMHHRPNIRIIMNRI
jgi:hypothetical protein